jgi:hypothetical protein
MSEANGKNKQGNVIAEASPTLIDKIVRAESPEFRQLRRTVEEGSNHPSDELLLAYANHRATPDDARRIMEHIALCGTCARKALNLTLQQEDLLDYLEDDTSQPSWLDRLKGFVSNLSFPVMIQTPALETVRGPHDEDAAIAVKEGDPIRIFVQVPEDGHVAVFHYSDKGGEARLVFPDRPSDRTSVVGGQKVRILDGQVEGPAGIQRLKVIWTKDPLIDPDVISRLSDADGSSALEDYFNELESLETNEWLEASCSYLVEDTGTHR